MSYVHKIGKKIDFCSVHEISKIYDPLILMCAGGMVSQKQFIKK